MRLTLLLACLLLPSASLAASVKDLMVHDAWAPPSIPGQNVGVAYVTLHNSTSEPVMLGEITSPQASRVEIHTHLVSEDGVMRMRKLANLAITAGSEIAMKPGGLHLMLFNPVKELKEGDHFTLTLQDSEGSLPIEVKVQTPTSAAGDHSGHETDDKSPHNH